jgi:hypothetical protein
MPSLALLEGFLGSGDRVPRPATLGLFAPDRPRTVVRLLPVLAAAAAVVVLAGGFGLVRLGVVSAPGLNAVVDGQAPAAAPAPHPPAAEPLPVYFVENQNGRWALVREFTPTTLTDPDARLLSAVRLAVAGRGTDPDHTSVWRAAGLPAVAADGLAVTTDDVGAVTVRLPATLLATSSDVAGPSANLAVQQLVWTATATVRDTAPVRVTGPEPGAKLFGTLALDRRFARDAADPRAPVWVSSLVDAQQLTLGRAVIQGDAVTTATGTVSWQLRSGDGSAEIGSGVTTLHREDGGVPAAGDRAVWEVELQLPAPGRYEFRVSQSWPDPTTSPNPATSADPWVDTKTLIVS